MTCWSCTHSRESRDGRRLWCWLHTGPAIRRCKDFDYEPGTDEVVRHEEHTA